MSHSGIVRIGVPDAGPAPPRCRCGGLICPPNPMIVVFTGQVGVGKTPYIARVGETLHQRTGQPVTIYNVGDMMYRESGARAGHILDLPPARLEAIRRSVFKDVLAQVGQPGYHLLNFHISFRWHHGLFPAFDPDLMWNLNAGLYLTVVDNVQAVHDRLLQDHTVIHDLRDILVWREEEWNFTQICAQFIAGRDSHYLVCRGVRDESVPSIARLIQNPKHPKVYPSFPVTHVIGNPKIMGKINAFRELMAQHFVVFDPLYLEEKDVPVGARRAQAAGQESISLEVNGHEVVLSVTEVLANERIIDAQINHRDFTLIDQSDLVICYVPALEDGSPGLSSGVEREAKHGREAGKEVHLIWEPACEPSPMLEPNVTRRYSSIDELVASFRERGLVSAAA